MRVRVTTDVGLGLMIVLLLLISLAVPSWVGAATGDLAWRSHAVTPGGPTTTLLLPALWKDPTPTPTPIPTPTPTPTPMPATGWLRIVNQTGGSLTASVVGPARATWTVPDGQTVEHSLPVGNYQLSAEGWCGSRTDPLTISAMEVSIETYRCVSASGARESTSSFEARARRPWLERSPAG